ncbi:MAG: glycoside hydrolase family 31 protein [Anaerolineae bacterium]|nr:glycoside hydrolase family 31 protein [Anaerolineae bacterium]
MFASLVKIIRRARTVGLRTSWHALWYGFTARRQAQRFEFPPPATGPWNPLGTLLEFRQDAQGVTLHTEVGSLRIDVLAADCLRVRLSPGGTFSAPFSYSVAKTTWEPVAFDLEADADELRLRVGAITCHIARDPLRLTVTDGDGRVICQDAGGPAWRELAVRLSLRLMPGEAGYGLGERAFGLNLRGRSYRLWNAEPHGYGPGADPINLCIPFYVGQRGDWAYGVFWDNTSRGDVSVGAPGTDDELVFSAESAEMRYYLFTGPGVLDVLERYTELTGRMMMPPLWALGYQQSRWSYMTAEEVRAVAGEFRQRRIPCDAIYFDIDYMDGYRCFTWDARRFGDHRYLLQELRHNGFHPVVIIDPGIRVDLRYWVCRSGIREDAFLKYPNGDLFVAPVWPGNCLFPDFTHPVVRDWWGRQYRPLLKVGAAGFWNDMNEPALFGSGGVAPDVPDYIPHYVDGTRGYHCHREMHNVYGMLMARATREGLERFAPEQRHLVITRAGWAGVQRYASSWTADNHSTWEHLRLSIPMCLNLGMSGLSFTGPDVGGFAGDADGELFTRWVQLAAFLPFFRGHTRKGTVRQEPWAFGQPYEDICRRTIELRYRLLPYLYTAFALCAAHGWPIVRPLALRDAAFADCDDQYLLGEGLLVAPVVEQGAVSRTVRLPQGAWYGYWDAVRHDGGQTITVDAPLERLPLFVRAGTVLPHWPVRQYVGESPVGRLELRVYPGTGETPLYADAGAGKAYQEGEYRWSRFTTAYEVGASLLLAWTREGPYQPDYDAAQVRVVGLEAAPQQVVVDGQLRDDWQFEAGVLSLLLPEFGTLRLLW